MDCYRCGGYVQPDDHFCARCGTPVDIWEPTPLDASRTPHPRPRPQFPPAPPPYAPRYPGRRRASKLLITAIVAGVLIVGAAVGLFVATNLPGREPGRHATQAAGPAAVAASPARTPAGRSAKAVDDFAAVYRRVQSGVVRIEVLGCSQSGIGTGFLLSPTLVATVDHVVANSLVVSLVDGDQHTTGHVIGSDPNHDLALVQADSPIHGYHLSFATTNPQVGQRVAAVGFPIGDPITLTQGGVSGLDRSVSVDGQPRSGLLETDAPVNPGNSGGPLLTSDGTVAGLVDALDTGANGIAYAVPSAQAAPQMAAWQSSADPTAAATCATPLGPSQVQTSLPAVSALNSDASAGVSAAFETYFDGINSGDYESAWQVLSPRLRSGSSYESFADGDASSYDFGQVVLDAGQLDSNTADVTLAFTSLQSPDKGPDGDTCDDWTLVYTMIRGTDGHWYIDATNPYQGSTHTTC